MAIYVSKTGVGLSIGIIVLALVIVGGLYAVKEHSSQLRHQQAIEIAQSNLEASSKDVGVLNTDQGQNQGNNQANNQDQNQMSPESSTNSSQPSGDESNSKSSGQLPTTGPEDMMSILVPALLTLSLVSFIQSASKLRSARTLDF